MEQSRRKATPDRSAPSAPSSARPAASLDPVLAPGNAAVNELSAMFGKDKVTPDPIHAPVLPNSVMATGPGRPAGMVRQAASGKVDLSRIVDKKTWDVFFDTQNARSSQQVEPEPVVNRDPVILDLNENGKHDTGAIGAKGDGKMTGDTVLFDLDPNRQSWQFRTRQMRPGNGVPPVPRGKVVYDSGRAESIDRTGNWRERFRGQESGAKVYDAKGEMVGELREGQYHYGEREDREKTEWMKPGGGDGFLVWDIDGDGKITSGKELFSEFDAEGREMFKNGFEKLAHYFDKDKDGVVAAEELEGLKVWVDANANGVTDKGELQTLESRNIVSFDTRIKDEANNQSTMGVKKHVIKDNLVDIHKVHTKG